jgi:uncharacterized protein with FMN-binding domain
MRRAVPAVIITAFGVAALASFHSTPAAPARSSATTVAPATVPAAAPPDPGSTPTTGAPASTTPTSGTPTNTTPTTGGATRSLTGDPFDNRYGTVQVRVTVQGRTITNVTMIQMPDSHERSLEISQEAAPLLLQEALQAQSAQIDIVSGATYTSEGYAQSLQSALDKSGS